MNEESNKESLDVLKQEPICYLEKEADWTLKKYSLEQIENWSNSKRIIIYSDDEQLKHFIEECLIDKTYSKKLYFGIVSDVLADEVYERFHIDIHNFNCSLSGNEVRKILTDHGSEELEAARGQRAVEYKDFMKIPYVISKPSAVQEGGEYRNKPCLKFVRDGYTVVGVVSDKHLDLFIQTMYIHKKEALPL